MTSASADKQPGARSPLGRHGGDLEAASRAVIADCGGNPEAAVRTLIVALDFAERQLERLAGAVSRAYARDLFYRDLERWPGQDRG